MNSILSEIKGVTTLDEYIKILNTNSNKIPEFTKNPVNYAISTYNFELLNYLYEKNYTFDKNTFNYAIKIGNIKILQWLKDHNCPWDDNMHWDIWLKCGFKSLRTNKHKLVIKWLIDNNYRSEELQQYL